MSLSKWAMSFIFCDASNGKLIDIVEDRRLSTLKPYFMRFSKEAREGVTHVVIDMYAPYMTLIKEVFPNAKIVLDKFHVVQLLSRALNKTRIRFMNQNKEFYKKSNIIGAFIKSPRGYPFYPLFLF